MVELTNYFRISKHVLFLTAAFSSIGRQPRDMQTFILSDSPYDPRGNLEHSLKQLFRTKLLCQAWIQLITDKIQNLEPRENFIEILNDLSVQYFENFWVVLSLLNFFLNYSDEKIEPFTKFLGV